MEIIGYRGCVSLPDRRIACEDAGTTVDASTSGLGNLIMHERPGECSGCAETALKHDSGRAPPSAIDLQPAASYINQSSWQRKA